MHAPSHPSESRLNHFAGGGDTRWPDTCTVWRMLFRPLRLYRPPAAVLCIALAACCGLGCREDEEGLKVTGLEFKGAKAITAAELRGVIATRESGFLPWTRRRLFDRRAFEADLDRIRQFYRDNGYPNARVVSFDAKVGDDQTIDLVVTIDEGRPLIVEAVRMEGFDGVPGDRLDVLRSRLPLQAGGPQKRAQVLATRDVALRQLQEAGFAHAAVDLRDEPGSREGQVVWTVAARPGPPATFGPVAIAGNVSVGEDVIRRELTFKPGDRFTLAQLHESQRRLLALELFQYANIEPALGGADPEVPVRITVAEGKPRQLEGSVGVGSEEKLRGEIDWRHHNFLGGARTGGIEAKWSALDRGVRLNFQQPFFLGGRQSLAASVQRWYLDEPGYQLDTTGLRVSVNRERGRRDPVTNRGVTTLLSGSVIHELESFRISNETLADLRLRDDLIALGLDPRTGAGEGTLVALAFDARRDTTTNILSARQGYLVSAHLEQAGSWLPGDFDYLELSGEGRHYFQVGSRVVVANRVRLGSIDGRGPGQQVPFFKRYFLGGSTSLRGWGRFEVAPLSGSGLPLGGFTFLEASTEARLAAFGKVGLVAFVDAGNVWDETWKMDLGDLRVDAGPGLRYDTPIGPVRFDVGVQLTPIEGLLVDGKPEPRRWRMHFSIGHAF